MEDIVWRYGVIPYTNETYLMIGVLLLCIVTTGLLIRKILEEKNDGNTE